MTNPSISVSTEFEDIKRVAKLAKLDFSEAELQKISQDFSGIMHMISKIKELDCSAVEALSSVCNSSLRMRDDVENEEDISNDLFLNAPDAGLDFAKNTKYFAVPKVIE